MKKDENELMYFEYPETDISNGCVNAFVLFVITIIVLVTFCLCG